MRVVLAIATVTMTLWTISQPMQAQVQVRHEPILNAIDMIDGQTGWAMTIDSLLLRSTDGGTNWRDVTPLRSSGQKTGVFRITALSSEIAWVIPAGPSGSTTTEIFRTSDGGRTWRNSAIRAPSVTSISFINPREGWLLASLAVAMGHEAVHIYRSTDGGETWIKVAGATHGDESSGLPFGGNKSAVSFLNPTTGWITGITPGLDSMYLYATRDGGHTWRYQNMPLLPELTPHWMASPQPPRVFSAFDALLTTFFAVLNDSGEQKTRQLFVLYATHDGGATWTYTAPVGINMSGLAYSAVADMNHAWVLNGGVLRVTSDGGRRWTTLPQNPLFADVTQLDFISSQVGWAVRQTMKFVVGGQATFPFLLKTLDAGRTWESISYTVLK